MSERDDLQIHYGLGLEHDRLFRQGRPSLEYVRTKELLDRFLPHAPARIADVGGGTGAYAAPLAREGFEVTLVDPVQLHIEKAREVSATQPRHPFATVLGDARKLPLPSGQFDAVLFLGPLHHITDRAERIHAVKEAARILRPAGLLAAVGITRFRSLLGGLIEGELRNPLFRPIVEGDLRDGQHRNPDPANHPEFFTTAYFHLPDELADEVTAGGLVCDGLYGIEGPGWFMPWGTADAERREDALFAARSVEREPSMIGFSAHLMAIGRKPR